MDTVFLKPERLAQLEAYARRRGQTPADALDDVVSRTTDGERDRRGLDWSLCPAVESVAGKVSGAWVFRNSRTPVSVVFENLEDGMTIDEVIQQFPVSRDEITAVLEFAARSLDAPARRR